MKLYVSLVFICMILTAVHGLKCYTCWGVHPGSCNQVWDCSHPYDRCATTIVAENMISKHCMKSDMCNNVYSVGVRCCTGDLCNGARHTEVFVPLLLASLAVIKVLI